MDANQVNGNASSFIANAIPKDNVSSDGAFTRNTIKPIAVVGFSIRFPEDATTSDSFWKMLMERRCVTEKFPKERFNSDAFYHADANRSGTWQNHGGFFVKGDLGAFDAPFFSITPKEAAAMDPQQRGILETTYRALESAGLSMDKISGSKTSVYTASFCDDYKSLMAKDPEAMPKHAALGVALTMLANRVSWFFNLKGPSVHMDSACSSSLTALDSACQNLQNGGSKMAIVAGANLIFSPDQMFLLSHMNFLSPDSRCFSFDERANGYARGEGYGIVILKLLDDALKDNDTIRAVIRSTGSNQDGRSPVLTQPSREAQETLIRETYAKAGLDMSITRFVEAHGTGTPVGDPIEASAIGGAFKVYRSLEDPLFIGAVKSNIGHLEGAAGIAGLVKTILILERGIIPPNVFENLNPKIDTDSLNIQFPAAPVAWPTSGLRRASVNSFGFGGSNSHVVVDDAYNFLLSRGLVGKHCTTTSPPRLKSPSTKVNGNRTPTEVNGNRTPIQIPKLLVWSAADEGSLVRLTQLYEKHFNAALDSISDESSFMENISYTLSARRSSLPWRSFAVVESLKDLSNIANRVSRPHRTSGKNKLGFIFTGQGAQFFRMGIELLSFPIFKASLLKSDAYLRQFGCDWSVIDELCANKEISKINEPAYSQPLCTILQIALVDLLRFFGLGTPSAVVGHSSGEVAAAYSIGALSQKAACQVTYFRGKLAATIPSKTNAKGAMMAVGLSEAGALSHIATLTSANPTANISIGCINSPTNVTITGDADQIDALKVILDEASIFARKLQVDVAYHSSHMNIIADEYADSLQNLSPGDFTGSATMVSSVTGRVVSKEELCKGDYWVQNMVSPVRFSDALSQIVQRKETSKLRSDAENVIVNNLLEVGPHSALQAPARETLKSISGGEKVTYTSVLTRFTSALVTTLQTLGRMHCLGYGVHIINQHDKKSLASFKSLHDLPEYPFDHSKIYWHENALADTGYRHRRHPKLDLLGTAAPDWNPLEARWRHFLKISESPWIQDHKVNGLIMYPAVGMLVMVIEGIRQLVPEGHLITGYIIKDAAFTKPIPVSAIPEEGTETQLFIHSEHENLERGDSWCKFRLCVLENGGWVETCSGSIHTEFGEANNEVSNHEYSPTRRLTHDMQALKQSSVTCNQTMDSDVVYEHFASSGIEYGPTFRRLQNLQFNDRHEVTASIDLFRWIAVDNANHWQPHVVHPTSLDSLAQLIYLAISNGAKEATPTAVPTRVSKIWLSNAGLSHSDSSSINAVGTATSKGFRQIVGSAFASHPTTGNVLVSIENMEFTTVTAQNAMSSTGKDSTNLFFNMQWMPSSSQPDDTKIWEFCKRAESPKEDRTSLYTDISGMIHGFICRAVEIVDESHTESKSHLRRYIAWMKREMERATTGHLSRSQSEWKTFIMDKEHFQAVCERVKHSIEGRFFLKIGENLPQIVREETDPLEILFKDNLVRDYYEYVNDTLISFDPIARYLEVLSHGNPQLNVLEIGAGTGSTSLKALASLLKENSQFGCSKYHFTDISPAFFEAAKERFHNYSSWMKFKTLNIEMDPVDQGFESGSYDVIFAGLVLHATKDLDATLKNVRSLLKPGGSLILLELVTEDLRTSFAFGLLPGWWLSTEDYRKWSPHCSRQQWDALLEQNGFSRTKMEVVDTDGPSYHNLSWLVSIACETMPSSSAVGLSQAEPITNVTILVWRDQGTQLEAAYLLKKELMLLNHLDCDIVSLQNWAPREKDDRFFISLLELGNPLLPNLTSHEFGMLQQFLTHVDNIFWIKGGGAVSQDLPEYGSSDGFLRTLQSESNKLSVVALWLQDPGTSVKSQVDTIIYLFKHRIMNKLGRESEYVEKDGLLNIGRLIPSPASNQDLVSRTKFQQLKTKAFNSGSSLSLKLGSPGFLDSFYFAQDDDNSIEKPLGPIEIEIEVKAVGINFRDLLTALGRVEDSKTIGCDCSGVVTRVGLGSKFRPGDRVCANKLGTMRTYCRSNDYCASKIPDDMSFVTGASLPLVFTTAYHSLVEIARIRPGQTVLIHSGAGGTGGAAIQIAKYFKAEVFTTVGSRVKKDLVMELYGIPEDHIFFSRDISFAEDIMRMTNGRGVDIILNSLSGKALISSWECIAPFGHFVEIGKRDILAHKELPMFQFARNVSFNAVDLAEIINEHFEIVQKSFRPVMGLIRAGLLKPITPLHVYKISELQYAFQYMQSGKNTGKIVIDIQPHDEVLTLLPTVPTWNFDSNATYVIAGGLGGLGRVAASWFVKRGARFLILLSRSGPKSQEAIDLVQELKLQGVCVETPQCDVSLAESLAAVISRCAKTMPPIKGCIQGSMVLKDAIFENMTFQDWKTAVDPRIQGSWNLHTMLPEHMDFFLLFSSVCGLVGFASQANYAAGNTYMDALAHYRSKHGQKAVSLDLGWMESAGALHENEFLRKAMETAGHTIPIPEKYFIAILDKYCDPNLEVGTNVQVAFGLQTPAGLRAKNADILPWMARNTFNHFDQFGSGDVVHAGVQKSIDYLSAFQASGSESEAKQIVIEGLVKKISVAVSQPVENIDISKPLYEYGVDSLLAVELRNWFSRELRADVAVFDIMGSANFEALCKLALQRSLFKQTTWEERGD